MSHNDSEHLLTKAQTGDRAALEQLLARHREGAYRYGLRVCRTSEDAEDAVQETLWAAFKSIGGFRRAASFTTWLFTIVHNHCVRLGSRRAVLLPETELGRSPEDDLIAGQLRRMLAEGLARLEPQSREVILLRDVEGLTAPEAAATLGIGSGALKSRLHRARAQLRHQLSHLRS